MRLIVIARSALGLMAVVSTAALQATPFDGHWSGPAVSGDENRLVMFDIRQTGETIGVRYSIPALQLADIPLDAVVYDEASDTLAAGHVLTVRRDGDALTGTLRPMLLHGPGVEFRVERTEPLAPAAWTERAVVFESRGFRISGTLVAPREGGPSPALVSLHGSGPSTRWFALGRARRFAEGGYATLIYDKPGNGESEGSWLRSSLDDMALDAITALAFLRAQPEVEGNAVGLLGHSQAGWIISRAAGLGAQIDFAIVLAGGGASPREVERSGYEFRLSHSGIEGDEARTAMAFVERYFDYLRTGDGYEALRAAMDDEANASWVEALGIRGAMPGPSLQPYWAWVATYEPIEDIRRIDFPVQILFARADHDSPVEGLARWEAGLEIADNRQVMTRIVADADHHFLLPPETPGGWPRRVEAVDEIQIEWLNRTVRR